MKVSRSDMDHIPGGNIPYMGNQAHGGMSGNGQIVSLSNLLDLILQRTYNELLILSEILPRKTDLERKTEILQFASRSRNLFIRLLALVKWANGASKVEKCGAIMQFLDQQSAYFVDSADQLARMARESLVNARLPSFALPIAVDVLTTGTFKRMPTCIKERIVPADPITMDDKKRTLHRLSHIIEQRLVSQVLPKRMRQITFDDGIVKFIVNHEFRVSLTLTGDSPTVPWKLLKLEFLVQDPEIGACRSLVHPLQINYLKDVVQSRLMDTTAPLHDLYNTLHSFCQSLQLEVLYSQSLRLVQDRWKNFVHIEQYMLGHKLTLIYWCEKNRMNFSKNDKLFKLMVHIDEKDPSKPLKITHIPPLQGTESTLVSTAIKSDYLSIDKLFIHIVHVRSITKLNELMREFTLFASSPCTVSGIPITLHVPMTPNSTIIENLLVGIEVLTGKYIVSCEVLSHSSCKRLQHCVNSTTRNGFSEILTDIKYEIIRKRYELAARSFGKDFITILPVYSPDELKSHFTKYACFVPIAMNALRGQYYLAVDFIAVDDRTIKTSYFLLKTSKESEDSYYIKIEDVTNIDEISVKYMKNRFTAKEPKRKATDDHVFRHYNTEFADVLSDIQDRILFTALAEELRKRNVHHSGVILDDSQTHLTLGVNSFPSLPDVDKESMELFQNNIIQCKFHIHKRVNEKWLVEMTFAKNVLRDICSDMTHMANYVQTLYDLSDTIEVVADCFLKDLSCLASLYGPTHKLAVAYKQCPSLQQSIQFSSFTFKRLQFCYGPSKCYCASIMKAPNSSLKLNLGCSGSATSSNPHILAAVHLQKMLQETSDLVELARVLSDTCEMYASVSKLNTSLHLVTTSEKPSPVFSIIVQSTQQLRIMYRNIFLLDVTAAPNSQAVYVRDAKLHQSLLQTIQSIPQLYSFLNMYVDEAVLPNRRHSVADDDHPMSPLNDGIARISNDLTIPGASPQDPNLPASPALLPSPATAWRTEAKPQVNQTQVQGGLSTLLSYQALSRLMTPGPPPSGVNPSNTVYCSALERFLACAAQRRKIAQLIKEKCGILTQLQSPDRLSTVFKSDSLTYKISLDAQHMQVLRFQVTSDPAMPGLERDDALNLERIFDAKVACPPYKMSVLSSFITLLCVPVRILKDLIHLMKLEFQPNHNHFHFKLLLSYPVTDAPIQSLPGYPTFILSRDRRKCIFMMEFSLTPAQGTPKELAFVLAFVYDAHSNKLTMLPPQNRQAIQTRPKVLSITEQAKTLLEQMNNMHPTPRTECTLAQYVRDVMHHININLVQ
ncbi:DgyrCDS7889 [Dimorphilus gyrociliatus]|uniref:Mediator of RNA polymerase II transcription subunit 14 n=1 Tax=Dimorphilus gyrociliatus TaxID=2664684 RepID=A0A7I8VSJ2_9ANNE|nr:DgyrCDS7889 [Dimorphilus gyrociliatus]